MKSKGVMIGVAAGLVAAALALASLNVSTTSGQSTDEEVVPAATTTTTTPPQAPVEPVTDPNAGNAGNAGAAPGELPQAGFGTSADNTNTSLWLLLGMASIGLAAGAGLMVAGRGRGVTSR